MDAVVQMQQHPIDRVQGTGKLLVVHRSEPDQNAAGRRSEPIAATQRRNEDILGDPRGLVQRTVVAAIIDEYGDVQARR